jgi:hypothetical protein
MRSTVTQFVEDREPQKVVRSHAVETVTHATEGRGTGPARVPPLFRGACYYSRATQKAQQQRAKALRPSLVGIKACRSLHISYSSWVDNVARIGGVRVPLFSIAHTDLSASLSW